MSESMKLHFSVDCDWLNDFIRTRYFSEGLSYENTLAAIKESIILDGATDEEKTIIAQDILLGRKRLTGDSETGASIVDTGTTEDALFTAYTEKKAEVDRLKESYWRLEQAWEELSLVAKGELCREDCECKRNQRLFQTEAQFRDSVRRIVGTEQADPYGFFSPDGEFFPIEYGGHNEFACKWCKENGVKFDDYPLDYLIQERGWVLMHNPGLGQPFPTMSETKPLTKAQREAMYDYYVKAGREKEAYALYEGGL